MTTKIKLSFLFLVLTGIFYFTDRVSAGCPPSWNLDYGTFELCPAGTTDYRKWKINWQDGNIGYQDNTADGQCCARVSCYPRLEEPFSFSITINGAQNEEWREVAYDKRCNGYWLRYFRWSAGCIGNPPMPLRGRV